MKIVVNRELCESNGVCVRRAPGVFELDDGGEMHVLIEHPGPERLEQVKDAVKRCPRVALSLVDAC